MTTHFVPAPWRERLKLSNLWRRNVAETPVVLELAAAIPAEATQKLPPEGAAMGNHRIHVSAAFVPDPGQETTALGVAETGTRLTRDPSIDQKTQVIRPRDELTGRRPTLDRSDPPIFLRTLAEVRRLRALPPAAVEASDGEETTAWATTGGQPAKEVEVDE